MSHFDIGPPTCARYSFGSQPVGMKRAVRKPHAMKAPMFGMTMPERKRPNFCMASWAALFCFAAIFVQSPNKMCVCF